MPNRIPAELLNARFVLLALLFLAPLANAEPVVAIIIDDIGYRPAEGRRAAMLPGPVALSVLPHSPHGKRLARLGQDSGKEIFLHQPLESVGDEVQGAGGIFLDTTRAELNAIFRRNLEALPPVVGVTTHMGSLLTRHPGHMQWLVDEIKSADIGFFVDSRTTPRSVALSIARESGVQSVGRDIFLDRDPTPAAIASQFEQLKSRAARKGYALALGHPYPETMEFLETALTSLEKEGLRLVSVTDLVAAAYKEDPSWQAYSYRSQTVLKK